MKALFYSTILSAGLCAVETLGQPFDILGFDPESQGPWSEPGRTTLVVPKVANGSIVLNGDPTSQEYGGFSGVTVTPGVNAWILSFPDDRVWGGPEDSSFTYWLAHDDDNFYIGVKVQDDVVNSDDPNAAFWKDDSIEIVVDALNDRLDNNTDNSHDPVGGHSYVNFQGRFSQWEESTGERGSGMTWATNVNWKYGPNEDVYGVGQAVAGGWAMEVRFRKRLFEDAAAGNKLREGYRMGFNIGLDDDDKTGPGPNGDQSRSQDLEIQYFWANRQRRIGMTADYLANLTPEQRAAKVWLLNPADDANGLPLGINGDGRLAHGGTGEIFFGYDKDPVIAAKKILYLSSNGASPINADPALIALLQARGYSVTAMTPPATADELRTAAAGYDLVIMSETLGSTSILDPVGDVTGNLSLKDRNIPIISFEPYMFDNADWTARGEGGANDWINWGNTSRAEVDAAIQDPRDSLYILKPTHPIAGGLTGKVQVYSPPYSLNFGLPSADADIVASVQPDGSYPTIFVYERGDKLVDGSVAPAQRIGFFLGQAANPNANWATDYADLTAAGRALFLNTVAYALGLSARPAASLTAAMSGTEVVITYTGGTLESADNVTGAWAPETGASPLRVQPSAARKFFRLKAN